MAFIRGTAGIDNLAGTAEDDIIVAAGANDILDGAAGTDRLYGGDGGDQLSDFAGEGAGDRLFGQAGDDIVQVTGTEADYLDGGFGFDVFFSETGILNTVIDLDNQALNAGDALGDQLRSIEGFVGGLGNDRFYGSNRTEAFGDGRGNDLFDGRGGIDQFFFQATSFGATQVTFELGFGARAAELAALASYTRQAAGSGVGLYTIWNDADVDTVIDPGEVTYQVSEVVGIEQFVTFTPDAIVAGSGANETFYIQDDTVSLNAGGGTDTVSFALFGGSSDPLVIDLALDTAVSLAGTVVLDNVENAVGSSENDEVLGDNGVNRLGGSGGSDFVDGRGGNDRLEGGAGFDAVTGGEGNDFLVGGADGDLLDGGDGTDTAIWATATAAVVVRLGFDATGNGEGEGDSLESIENVVGSRFNDRISGDTAANVLEGYGGADRLFGGDGDDMLYIDRNPDSFVPAGFLGFGPDIVRGDGFEDIEEQGYSYGSGRAYGQDGNDQLFGGAVNDQLYGGAGNDRLDGGRNTQGSNYLYGGDGDDLYVVRDEDYDYVTELEDEGVDQVNTSGDYYLRDYVENLRLIGTRNADGFGNDGANVITGNAVINTLFGNDGDDKLNGGDGDDTLVGGRGADALTGGLGKDTFSFESELLAANVDAITDFNVADDTILLHREIFSAIVGDGPLAPAVFRLGANAADANDRIIYDQANGRIFYDADGNGAEAARVLFATVNPGTALTAANFAVVSNGAYWD